MAEEIEEHRRQLLADPNVYLKPSKWYELLQDAGKELDEKQKKKLEDKPRMNFTRSIRCGDRLFPNLYTAGEMWFITFQLDSKGGKWFTNLPKSKSDSVHKIGKYISENRTRVVRADIHTHQSEEVKAMMKEDQYKDKDVLYYLPQRELITHYFSQWGTKFEDLFKSTTDDKLRLLGILLTDEEVREFIPDVIGKRRNEKGRQHLDAAPARALAAWTLVLTKFIDAEVLVTFPEKWSHDEFMEQINERAGVEDFYAKHGSFNPNNTDRMKLPWTKKLLQEVLKDGRGEYEGMMKSYTMGTGGGPGAPENFADWQERDESYILKYTPQKAASLYLTIVFMWDKTHGFPLKPSVGKMPEGGREDEVYNGVDDAGGSDSNPSVPSSGKSSKGKGDSQIAAAIQHMTTKRQQSTKELLDAIMGHGEEEREATAETRSNKQHKLIIQMKETRESIKEVRCDLEELKKKRKKCEEKYKNNEKKKQKKMKKISALCKDQQEMINTLTMTLMQYNKDLAKLNETDGTKKALEYGSSSGSDSDDSSSSVSDSDDSSS